MLRTGILNPQINSLLSRVSHTDRRVIADRGFPFWPQAETVDISLVDDISSVMDVLRALAPNFLIGDARMVMEFRNHNSKALVETFQSLLPPIHFEPHIDFKRRVSTAIGLIRTAGTSPYSNPIIKSA